MPVSLRRKFWAHKEVPPKSLEQSLSQAFVWLAWVTFCLTFLKGFRLPNLWVATHYAFNYSQGFVRRGLIGEIARQLGGVVTYRYTAIVVVAFLILLAVLVTLLVAIRRALRSGPVDWSFRVALLVFLSSPGLVFFVHAVGYHDYLGLLFAGLIVLVTSRFRSPFWSSLLVISSGAAMAFIHEGLAAMFGPVIVFALASQFARLTAFRASGKNIALLLGLLALVGAILFGVSGLVSTFGQDDLERVQELKRYVQSHTDFKPRHEAFDALARSSAANAKTLMPWYWSKPEHVRLAVLSWDVFVPGFLWLLGYGAFSIWNLRLTRLHRSGLLVIYLGAATAPLLMNFVGWDWNRWNGLALLSCLVAIVTIKLNFPGLRRELPVPLLTLGLAACLVGLASTTPLFDAMEVQFFPFDSHWHFLRQLFEEDFRYRPRG
jgi:hypothetical protein